MSSVRKISLRLISVDHPDFTGVITIKTHFPVYTGNFDEQFSPFFWQILVNSGKCCRKRLKDCYWNTEADCHKNSGFLFIKKLYFIIEFHWFQFFIFHYWLFFDLVPPFNINISEKSFFISDNYSNTDGVIRIDLWKNWQVHVKFGTGVVKKQLD